MLPVARIIGQLLTESLLLALIGAAAGAALALFLSQSLVGLLDTEGNAIVLDLALGWRVLAIHRGHRRADVFTLRAGAGHSRNPSRYGVDASSIRPRRDDRPRSREPPPRARRLPGRALSALLVGALLFARTLFNLMHVDPGFKPEGITVVSLI